jgi:hypothetical protein
VRAARRPLLSEQLALQARACADLGSPLYAAILEEASVDAANGGPIWEVLGEHVEEGSGPRGSALPLRFMAAVHRLVLSGRAHDLAAFYPSAGGTEGPGVWAAFLRTAEEHSEEFRELLLRPCQTNEVGRTAPLLGGFLLVAERFGLPLRLLEMGTSAGLNLRWDRFRYESPAASWGDPGSPVRLSGMWLNPPPSLGARAEVVERRGCDPNPVDPSSEEGRLAMTASVWADQRDRLERLRGAIAIAERVPARVDPESGGGWVPDRLARPEVGVSTVLFHTVVWQYLSSEEQQEVQTAIHAAGARATPDSPLAWLRLEPSPGWRDFTHHCTLTVWPGGDERLVARAQPHGTDTEFVA